ncbi:MAG: aminotransferase class IV [bacterium]|nr:aminotransferase class IV [bacterium]
MWIYINGQFFTRDQAKVSVFDRGYLYGDAVFETMRVCKGKVFRLRQHLERLQASAKAILLDTPPISRMEVAVYETVQKNGIDEAILRLSLSRGEAEKPGLDIFQGKPTLVIIVRPFNPYPDHFFQEGISVVTVPTLRGSGFLPQIKSANFLTNILAKQEAVARGAFEGIMLDEAGYVTEGTISNIFIVDRAGRLVTPPACSLLKGITREAVLELAHQEGLTTCQDRLTRYDLFTAAESFLTFTSAGIMPVVKIDDRKIGSGKVGPRTKQLCQLYETIGGQNE